MGGALFNHQGVLTVLNSTLAANSAVGGSGFAAGAGVGGAIFNLNGAVAITNATLAANTAAQGGGAIYTLGYDAATPRSAEVLLAATILADSTAGADLVVDAPANVGADLGLANASSSTVSAAGANIVESHSQSGSGQLLGVAPITTDPGLGALQDNGGPGMWTMAPSLPGPAIDAAPPADCAAVDQRGVERPIGAACDLGALEVAVCSGSRRR